MIINNILINGWAQDNSQEMTHSTRRHMKILRLYSSEKSGDKEKNVSSFSVSFVSVLSDQN